MKVSQWLREYQLTGRVPGTSELEPNPQLAFWCGVLMGCCRQTRTATSMDEARAMAIKLAEFIEEQV
jgi:hypothetical protein